MCGCLPAFQQNEGEENATQKISISFQQAMTDRASLLHERAGEIEFTHLTFQEFLCAYYLATNKSPAEIAQFFQEANRVSLSWWRETILLTIGYLAKTASAQALKLVQTLLTSETNGVQGLAATELAAAGLLEMEIPAPETRRNAHDRLVAFLSDNDQPGTIPLRALAGRTLSNLGDKRPGVGVIERDGIKMPDIAWSQEVPPGTYPYQNGTTEITHPYRLAKYPITYAQFQCFIEAEDVYDPHWWQGLPENEQTWGEQAFPYANHPRERVSWYQAIAFCRWLSDKLDQEIDLPLEQEWEVAARYPDGRIYPWGDEFDPTKANTNDKSGEKVGQTTAVSIYPSGKNEALDLYDMSGNVWEWCRNKYEKPEDDQIDDSGDRRVVRGGSWGLNQNLTRAAYRLSFNPDDRGDLIGFRVVVRRPLSHDH